MNSRKFLFSLSLISAFFTAQLTANPVQGGSEPSGYKTWVGDNVAPKVEERFGTERGSRDLPERLLTYFLMSGYDTEDGSFDWRKGATDTKKGLTKVAIHEMLHKAVREFVKKKRSLSDDIFKAFEKRYKERYKIWSAMGFDFVLRGIDHANDASKEQKLSAYLKDNYLPYAAKKLTVYFALAHYGPAIRKHLNNYHYGKEVVALYDVIRLVPLLGIIADDLPESAVGKLYDKAISVGKSALGSLKTKAQQLTAAAA